MGTITSQTNDNLNFSIKRIREDELEIPVDQEMILTKNISIYEFATLIIGEFSTVAILGDN